jgi:anti-sigma factor RsiW
MATAKFDEWALNAWVDGEVEDDLAAEIEAFLRANPEEAAQIAAWQRQKEALVAAFAGVITEEVPPALKAALKGRGGPGHTPRLRRLAIAASIVVGLLVAGLGGWQAGRLWPGETRLTARLQAEAVSAHVVYAAEKRHAVEVGAEEKDHLVTWLSKRLSHPLKAPDLSSFGFDLVGGRLLAADGEPAAMLMFQDGSGRRLTLYVAHNPANRETAFRVEDWGGLTTCYWLDGPLGYALAADLPRAEMTPIAHAVYDQMER